MAKKLANRLQVNALLKPIGFHALEAFCKQKRLDRSSVIRAALDQYLSAGEEKSELAEMREDMKKILAAQTSGVASPQIGQVENSELAEMRADIKKLLEGQVSGGQIGAASGIVTQPQLEKIAAEVASMKSNFGAMYTRLKGDSQFDIGHKLSIPALSTKLDEILSLLRPGGV